MTCPSCGRENAADCTLLLGLRNRADGAAARTSGAEGGDRPLRRPRRLHRARPSGSIPRTSRRCSRYHARVRAELERSAARSRSSSASGRGALRRPGRARGRSRARSARGARDPRLGRARRTIAGAHRRQHGRGARHARCASEPGREDGRRRRGQHRRPPADAPRRSTASSSASRRTERPQRVIEYRDRAGRREGKAEPVAGLAGGRGALARSASTSRRAAHAARRPRARARRCSRRARSRPRRARAAARHARRRSRDRQVAGSSTSCPSASRRTRAHPWRQGRCLPYGEGVSFWALGEMVKAQAGILETDSAAAAKRSSPSCPRGLRRADGWVERTCGRSSGSPVDGRRRPARARRSRPGGASSRRWPTAAAVLVFEDLHWADEGCSTSSTTSSTGRRGVPLLVRLHGAAGAARAAAGLGRRQAERDHDRARAALGGGDARGSSARCSNARLSPAEPQQSCSRKPAANRSTPRSTRGCSPSAAQRDGAARDRAGDHRGAARRALGRGEGAAPGRRRRSARFLVGRARGAGRRRSRRSTAPALARAEGVRPPRTPVVRRRRDEYAFRHVLVRDVAYGQIPRAQRARSTGAPRSGSSRSRSARRPRGAARPPLRQRARVRRGAASGERAARALARGGRPRRRAPLVPNRPAGTTAPQSNSYRTKPPDERGGLLLCGRRGAVRRRRDGRRRAARGERAPRGVLPGARGGGTRSSSALIEKSDQRQSIAHFERAVSLVADLPPTREKGNRARAVRLAAPALERARAREEMTQAALEIAEALGDDDARAQALRALGQSRLNLGDPDGLDDMERALELALESNSLVTAQRVLANLADSYASHRADLARCFELQAEGRRLVDRVGGSAFRYFFAGERVAELYIRGDWDEASALGGQSSLEELSRHPNPHFIQVPTRAILARIAAGRGDEERAESESSGRARARARDRRSAGPVLRPGGARRRPASTAGGRRTPVPSWTSSSRTRRASSSERATHTSRGSRAYGWSGCASITDTARDARKAARRHAPLADPFPLDGT